MNPSKDKLQNLKGFIATVVTDKVTLKDYNLALEAGILALNIVEQLQETNKRNKFYNEKYKRYL